MNRQEQIREAAVQVMAREGFHQATTDRIAAQAGVAVGTIYNYYRSKEEILADIFRVEYRRRADYLDELNRQQLPSLEKIQRVLRMHFSRVEERPELVRVILAEKARQRASTHGDPAIKGLPGLLQEMLAEGIQTGELQPVKPAILATLIFGAIEAAMSRYLDLREQGDQGSAFLQETRDELEGWLRRGLGRA